MLSGTCATLCCCVPFDPARMFRPFNLTYSRLSFPSLSLVQSECDLDIETLRSVFRLAGDDIHVTHIPPSSPAKSAVGRSPSERFHQAPTPSIGDYFLNYLVAKRKKQSVYIYPAAISDRDIRQLYLRRRVLHQVFYLFQDLFGTDDFVSGCQEILDVMSETNYCAEMYIGTSLTI